MTVAATLAALRDAGVRVALRADGRLALNAAAPPAAELLDRVRQHRDGLVLLLRAGQDAPEPAAQAQSRTSAFESIPDPDLDGYRRVALGRPPSWSDPSALPSPGCYCTCCKGGTWWSEAQHPRGWRCRTCHPPATPRPEGITELRT